MPETQAMFKFSIDGLSSTLDVVAFSGHEGVSQLFEFEIDLASDDAAIDFDEVIGKPALLKLEGVDDPRLIHGMVARFEETGGGTRKTYYRATLVPRVWSLGLRQDCCIFQDMKVPEIIQQVFEEFGLASGDDFKLSLNGDYPSLEYCVQYRETDLDFVCRLMEENGIFYFFEHDEGQHAMVLADDVAAYAVIAGDATLPYREPDTGMQGAQEEVTRVRFTRTLRPGKVELTDWNFKKPALDLASNTEASVESDLEVYDHPGRFADKGAGSDRSEVLLGALRAEAKVFGAESNCRRMTPGAKFTLDAHPRDDFNAEWLVLRLRHWGTQPQAAGPDTGKGGEIPYRNALEAIPSGVQFRPPRVTRHPTIDGPQTAIVTGPSGEEIHCDEHGRIKVSFHWDRVGPDDDKSSCWVRVSQLWSGAGYGGMAIPRVGNEVVVSFLEGDPDRPLITGHVYNAEATYGYSLPGDKTRTSIRSNTSPGGGGFNELRFEDASGNEEVFLHSQKDLNIRVLHDSNEQISGNDTQAVGGSQTLEVGGQRTRSVGHAESVKIGAGQTITVAADQGLKVGGNQNIQVSADRTDTVGGNETLIVTKNQAVTVSESRTLTVGKNEQTAIGEAAEVAIGKSRNVAVGENDQLAVGKNLAVAAGKSAGIVAEKKLVLVGKDRVLLGAGDDPDVVIALKSDGTIAITGKKLKVAIDGDAKISSSGNVTVKGSKVAIN